MCSPFGHRKDHSHRQQLLHRWKYSENCVLRPPIGPQKVVLFDQRTFIRGINMQKCRFMFLLKWSYGRWSLITVVLKHKFHCTSGTNRPPPPEEMLYMVSLFSPHLSRCHYETCHWKG